MNKEIKKKWIEALRSGEYRQGRGMLCSLDHHKYCCLGVLTDLYIKEHPNKAYWSDQKVVEDNKVVIYTGKSFLPEVVMRWAELEYADPIIPYLIDKISVPLSVHITAINDGFQYQEIPNHSFKQIADMIEESL